VDLTSFYNRYFFPLIFKPTWLEILSFAILSSQAFGFTFNAGFWKPTLTVTYDANGASGGTPPPTVNVSTGQNFTVSTNSGSLVRTGYTFGGWNTAAAGNGTTYTAGSGTFSIGTSNVVLYAKWNIDTYTVTYDANGATSGSVPTGGNFQFGATVSVAANSGSLARTGYIFGGWNTTSLGNGVNYSAGTDTFAMGASHVTLFAKWTSICSLTSYNVPGPTYWPYGSQIINVRLAGQTRTFLKVSPGTVFNLAYDFNVHVDGYCPGCVQQFYVGYAGQLQNQCTNFSRGSSFKTLSKYSVNLVAPATPGAYYLSTAGGWDVNCVNATIVDHPTAHFALICVQ